MRRVRMRAGATPREDGDPGSNLLVCGDCGTLGEKPGGDPMRSAPDPVLAACPACHGNHWLDPSIDNQRTYLEDLDERMRARRRPRSQRRATQAAGLLHIALALVLCLGASLPLHGMAWQGARHIVPALGFMAIPFGLALLVVIGGVRRIRDARGLPRPARWRWARTGAEGPVNAAGEARPIGDLLVAPLTGRACIAYEVGARADRECDEPDGTWLLLEQRATDMRIGDTRVPGDTIRLVPRHRNPVDVPDESARVFLRARGIAKAEIAQMYETIVVPGDTVRAHAKIGKPIELEIGGTKVVEPPRPIPWRRLARHGFTAYLIALGLGLFAPLSVGMLDTFHNGIGIKHMAGIYMTFAFGLPIVLGGIWKAVDAITERASPLAGDLGRVLVVLASLPVWVLVAYWIEAASLLWPLGA
jgi:hypothetical protein